MNSKPNIYAKFVGSQILGEGGRLLFALLQVFALSGYRILLNDNLTCGKVGHHGRSIFGLPGLEMADSAPDSTEQTIYLYDVPDQKLMALPWLKQVGVKYNIFDKCHSEAQLLLPYPVHPVHTGYDYYDRIKDLRTASKRVRVFFSGDVKGYSQNFVKYPEPKVPRKMAVEAIIQELPDISVHLDDHDKIGATFSCGYTNKCLLVDTSKTWIDDRFWLDHMARSDFFLALPGICMPMCHNIIEAMAVGAIPITSYPEWFRPKLIHMENCITYTNHGDLLRKIRMATEMSSRDIADLSKRTVEYYDKHLDPSCFIRDFESMSHRKVDVYIITEHYVKQNASRINAESYLIRGAIKPGLRFFDIIGQLFRRD